MLKVSVIIPVYNAEKTLRRCVESIVYGQFKDLEVILVEDHAKDDSWALCCALEKEFSCVKAVRNPRNCGVSCTRNRGLAEAQGEYVLFADSDDWVSGEYITALLEMGHTHPGCLAICGFEFIDYTANVRHMYLHSNEESVSELKKRDFFRLVDTLQIQNVWNKLFRMDIIRQKHICFDETKQMGEDFQFVLDYLEKGNITACKVINRPLYYYIRHHGDSLMEGFTREPIAHGEKRLRQLAHLCADPGLAEPEIVKLRNNYSYHIMRSKRLSWGEKRAAFRELWPDGQDQGKIREQLVLLAKESLVRCQSAPGVFLQRIQGRLRRELQNHKIKKIRQQLKQRNFTILSQNCIGGVFYHDMGMEFTSPTVNLYFDAPDFLRFAGDLDHYLAQELQMSWKEEYPVGILGDVTIHFMHYRSCTEAKDAWNRRAQRIRRDHIVLLCTDREGFGPEEYALWTKLPYRKLLFTVHPAYSEDSVVYGEYAGQESVPDIIGNRKFYRDNKLIDRLNSL